jgi:hypothetical protein
MSNTYEGITTILVPSVALKVEVNESGSNNISIGTDYLGPCLCFIFDFVYLGKQWCVLDHYTYPKDEKGLSPDQVLALLIEYFVDTIKFHIRIKPNQQISPSTPLDNMRLLVAGGVKKESVLIRDSLSSLNANSFELKNIFNDQEHLYLAEQLIDKIMVLNVTTRALTRSEEREGK